MTFWFTKSIRWRLQLWLAFLLASVLAGFGVTVYHLQRLHQLEAVDEELDHQVSALATAFRPPPRGGNPFGGPRRGPQTNDTFEAGGPGGAPGDRPPWDQPPGGGPGRGEPQDENSDQPRPGGGGGGGGGRREGGPPWARSMDGRPFDSRPRREFTPPAEMLALIDEASTNSIYKAAWQISGQLIKSSTNTPSDLTWPRAFAGDGQTRHRTRGNFREVVHFTEFGHCLVAGCSLQPLFQAMSRFVGLLFLAGSGLLVAGLAGSWWLTGNAIRPIAEISAAAGRISAGNLSERINASETDNEFGRLTAVLNSTFARLEAAFARQKEFVADASHELRTPLAVIISEAQTTLARERSAPEYRETVEACLQTAQQMRRLADSLLELARLDSGEEHLRREEFDLAVLTRDCAALIGPLAAKRQIRIQCDLAATPCHGDSQRLRQVITNLLSNATHYNRDGGEIRVSLRAGPAGLALAVEDTGEGIPPEAVPHLFERFYRVDKSRSRASGGTGLGLAISKAIAEAHGGALRVQSRVGVGSVFTLELPTAPGAGGGGAEARRV